MNVGKTLFAQIMEFVPWTSFVRIVQRDGDDSGVRRLSCSEQFHVMAFAQLTWRDSLRDIEVTLNANTTKLYALVFVTAFAAPPWPMPTIGPFGRTLLLC
jgi:hypothetical protein